MVEQNFWEMLRAKHDSLTKSGTIVADYLVQHAEDAQYLSISSLAKACGVAEATIFRFCRSLGFDGYNEMKIALAGGIKAGTRRRYADFMHPCLQYGHRGTERHPQRAGPRCH